MKKFILLTILFVINFSNVSAYNWKYLFTDDTNSNYFVDVDSLTLDVNNSSEIMYHAVFKHIYSDVGRRQTTETFLRNNGWVSPKHNQMSHSIFVEYFLIYVGRGAFYAIDSETVFTFDGSIIDEVSYSRSYHKWKPMMRGQKAFDLAGATLNYMLNNKP